jgi:cathepsin F
MKTIIILIVLTAIAAHMPLASDEEVFKQFMQFQHTHNKTYSGVEEFKTRFEIFRINYQKVSMTNSRIGKNGQPLYTLGTTQFMDLTPQEFAKQYLTLDIGVLQKTNPEAIMEVPKYSDAPDNWDWRDKNVVTEVKNQWSCGSCWAFSAIGNIESRMAIAGYNLTEYSEQQLVDCDKAKDEGCNGGLMEDAFTYLQTKGVMDESDYQYTGYDGKCQYDAKKIHAKVTGQSFAPQDEVQIKQLLYENGPYAIAINATPLQFYLWGIFDPWFEWICNPKELNHGVVLVGYGIERGYHYWIIKNSWSSSWGEKGYFRLIMGKGACGVDQYVITANVTGA